MEEFNNTINELLGNVLPQPNSAEILVSLATALVFSFILWGTYRLANTAATYQPRFAATLVALALLSTILMDLIQSNLALSLGMLGSLSIVRFRTNIKDPRDIGYIFWSMAVGLASATGCYLIGIVGSILLSVFMIATRKSAVTTDEMMLVIRGSNTDMDAINDMVNRECERSNVKAKNILSDSYELVYQVRVSSEASNPMIQNLFSLGGVDSVNLLAGQ
nr:DUF4956 domain-containing protein [uncultured Dysosmobacter sp.]